MIRSLLCLVAATVFACRGGDDPPDRHGGMPSVPFFLMPSSDFFRPGSGLVYTAPI